MTSACCKKKSKKNHEKFGSFSGKCYLCTAFWKRRLKLISGVLVQLVRIHACHAWGHGFESRTHRQIPIARLTKSRFCEPFFSLCHEPEIGQWRE